MWERPPPSSGGRVEWHGDALLELATGAAVEDVRATFKLDIPVDLGQGAEEEQLLKSLEHPAAQATFHWVKDDADLRQIIEAAELALPMLAREMEKCRD